MAHPAGRRGACSALAGGAPVVLVGIVVLISGCGLFQKDVPQEEDVDHQRRAIEEVQATHTPEWMEITGVVGTGILAGENAILRQQLSVLQRERPRLNEDTLSTSGESLIKVVARPVLGGLHHPRLTGSGTIPIL